MLMIIAASACLLSKSDTFTCCDMDQNSFEWRVFCCCWSVGVEHDASSVIFGG